MTTDQIREAHAILGFIKELEKSIESRSVVVKPIIESHHGCAVEPHRKEMMHAVNEASAAAMAVMQTAALRQISELKKRLAVMGVESQYDQSTTIRDG